MRGNLKYISEVNQADAILLVSYNRELAVMNIPSRSGGGVG